MKLLIAGCSLSSGWGFEQGRDDPATWGNTVANSLGATCENLAQTGSDNYGIFLDIIDRWHEDWDLILVQITALDRIVLRAVPEADKLITSENILPGWIPDSRWQLFHDVLTRINGRILHWFRLCKMLRYLQAHPRLYLINGLMDWDRAFWTQGHGQFLKSMFDPWQPTDDQIQQLVPQICQARDWIMQTKWINLDRSWYHERLDQVSPNDPHPGPRSHAHYAAQVLRFLADRP